MMNCPVSTVEFLVKLAAEGEAVTDVTITDPTENLGVTERATAGAADKAKEYTQVDLDVAAVYLEGSAYTDAGTLTKLTVLQQPVVAVIPVATVVVSEEPVPIEVST